MKKTLLTIFVLVLILAGGYYLATQDGKPVVTNNFAKIPNELELKNNLQKAGLAALSEEGTAFHIHQHLDLTINGQDIPIPAEIGVATTFISPLHTHDGSGVLHVEAPEKKDFKLGQFFDEWGVDFSDNCISTYCADANNKLIVAVNGKEISNPREYVLQSRDQIHIWYGPRAENPELIKEYNFAPNL